jgi:hypothetical protein
LQHVIPPPFELRLEARYDKSTEPAFIRNISEDPSVNPLADRQTGFALQGNAYCHVRPVPLRHADEMLPWVHLSDNLPRK